jgi:N-formylglutamate amidohydrolase
MNRTYTLFFLLLFAAGNVQFNNIQLPQIPANIHTGVQQKWIDDFTWVQYGNMPLVISVPHGGTIAPDSITTRACPGITTVTDSYTIELAKAIDSVFMADYGKHPSLIVTHLKRSKLDQNRPLPEANCNNEQTVAIWNRFHNSIDTALQLASKQWPQTLYIDLHGHGHANQRLELGYLLTDDELRNPATILPAKTSIASLITSTKNSAEDLLIGKNAFGTIIASKGFPAVPSMQDKAPIATESYFDGGYNTKRYTSTSTYQNVFGWQIESNKEVRFTAAKRSAFAKALAAAIMEYYQLNTQLKIHQ